MDQIPEFLPINAFRYALGRQTYVTAETSSWLISNWGNLTKNARFVIARDLREAIAEDDRDRRAHDGCGARSFSLGADMDRREWIKLRDFIESYKGDK